MAALGIAGPQAVGLASGRVAETILLSLGALCISFSDLTSSYRYRLRRVGLTVVLGGFGFGAGVLAPAPWTAACVVVTVSVLSVLASRMGDLWAAAGTQMLTFCIVATGTPAETMGAGAQLRWFLAGELMAFGLIAATWPFRRTAPARQAVARVFDTTVRMLTAETPRARTDARQALTKALDEAHDVLITVTAGATARSRVHDRLHVVLSQTTPMVEASVALAHAGSRPPERTLTTMRTLARCVRSGTTPPPSHPTAHETSTAVRALEQALAGLTDSLRTAKLTDPTELDNNRDRRARFRAWREGLAVGRTGWLLASRMALCLAVAELVGLALPLEHPYWVALTVALVLKPNSGSVFARGVLRGIGSVLGVVAATALLTFVPHGWWLLPFMVLLAAMVPDTLSRHYGLFTGVVTCLVLLKMTQVEPTPALPAVRLVDSLIGCAILLVVGGLLSPLHRHTPLAPRFASAVDTVSEYVSLALGGFERGRSGARRRGYRELSELRAALRQRLVEPTSANNAEKWWTSIIVLERLLDGATERAIHIERGDEAFSLQHTQRIVSSMRSTARQLREAASAGAVAPPADLPDRLAELGAEISKRHPEPPSPRREEFETAGR